MDYSSKSSTFYSRKFILASGIITSCFLLLACKRLPPSIGMQGIGSTFAIYTTGNVLKTSPSMS